MITSATTATSAQPFTCGCAFRDVLSKTQPRNLCPIGSVAKVAPHPRSRCRRLGAPRRGAPLLPSQAGQHDRRLTEKTSSRLIFRALPQFGRQRHLSRMNTAVTPLNAAPAERERRISAKLRQAIDLLLSGECATKKAAAARANLSPEHLSRSFREPHVRVFIERRVTETIAGAQMKAARVLEELLESGKSEHVRADVARHVLGIGGHVVKSVSPLVNVNVMPGYVIDLREPDQVARPLVDLSADQSSSDLQDVVQTMPKGCGR